MALLAVSLGRALVLTPACQVMAPMISAKVFLALFFGASPRRCYMSDCCLQATSCSVMRVVFTGETGAYVRAQANAPIIYIYEY